MTPKPNFAKYHLPIEPPLTQQDGQEQEIGQFIEENTERLLTTLHFFVLRANIGSGEAAWEIASELLNELVVEALDKAGRFDPEKSLYAWLLGIGANLVKRRQASQFRQAFREPLVHDLVSSQEGVSNEELFDWLGRAKLEEGPENRWVERETVKDMLGQLSEDDREIIRLAVLTGLNGEELARQIGTTPAAARVRLHRALQRLKKNWQAGRSDSKPNPPQRQAQEEER